MRIDILTLFPESCDAFLQQSIIGRARKNGKVEIFCHNIRHWTHDKHNRVDDAPYGGGMGMIMQAQPVFDCITAVKAMDERPARVIYLSPKGQTFCQKKAVELSNLARIILLCGHYEGIDERILEAAVDEEISIGNYVLTGGEIAAITVADAVCRLLPGVLSSNVCFSEESHWDGLLEYPQYTRPAEWQGRSVPEVLLSGHHANIVKWQRQQALKTTLQKRPELLQAAPLTPADRDYLNTLTDETKSRD